MTDLSPPVILAATLGALVLAGVGYNYAKKQKTRSFISGGRNKTRRR